jgi:hypothetical protein
VLAVDPGLAQIQHRYATQGQMGLTMNLSKAAGKLFLKMLSSLSETSLKAK